MPTEPHIPEHNLVAKLIIRTHNYRAYAAMVAEKLPESLWSFAI